MDPKEGKVKLSAYRAGFTKGLMVWIFIGVFRDAGLTDAFGGYRFKD